MTPVGLTEVGALLGSSEEAACADFVHLTELKLQSGYQYKQMKLCWVQLMLSNKLMPRGISL